VRVSPLSLQKWGIHESGAALGPVPTLSATALKCPKGGPKGTQGAPKGTNCLGVESLEESWGFPGGSFGGPWGVSFRVRWKSLGGLSKHFAGSGSHHCSKDIRRGSPNPGTPWDALGQL